MAEGGLANFGNRGHRGWFYQLQKFTIAGSPNEVEKLKITSLCNRDVVLKRTCVDLGSKKVVVGRGAYGVVYRATLYQPGGKSESVAVKKCLESTEEEAIREAQFLQHLQDTDYVPKFFGITEGGELGTEPCLVQSLFAQGFTLCAAMLDQDKLPQHLRPKVARNLARGLKAIHAKGVLLNDISGRNVLIDAEQPELTIKYIDMGKATYGSAPNSYVHPADVPTFAPEVQAGGPVTQASDIYSLGHLMSRLNGDASDGPLHHASQICMAHDPAERSLDSAIDALSRGLC